MATDNLFDRVDKNELMAAFNSLVRKSREERGENGESGESEVNVDVAAKSAPANSVMDIIAEMTALKDKIHETMDNANNIKVDDSMDPEVQRAALATRDRILSESERNLASLQEDVQNLTAKLQQTVGKAKDMFHSK